MSFIRLEILMVRCLEGQLAYKTPQITLETLGDCSLTCGKYREKSLALLCCNHVTTLHLDLDQ